MSAMIAALQCGLHLVFMLILSYMIRKDYGCGLYCQELIHVHSDDLLGFAESFSEQLYGRSIVVVGQI